VIADASLSTPFVNGRFYRRPTRPVVVVCFDGCDPAYLASAAAHDAIPALSAMMRGGFFGLARAAMPTFTNPNNIAIVCGAPPAVTGVSGNYYLDRRTGREVMLLDGALMEADTIPARLAAVGTRVAVVTAKDKLLKALARDLDGLAFSAENPGPQAAALGLPALPPDRYSAGLSLYVLDAGVALLEQDRADLLYLSLSDYVQHTYPPEAPEAVAFMRAVDARIARLLALGAVVGIVADHGMTDMAGADGTPRVVFVQDEIERVFGLGTARVICPITDPFVRHHASLGGFVRIYLRKAPPGIDTVRTFVAGLDGVALALSGEEACARFELPMRNEADIVVVAGKGVALGATAAEHDLSQLAGMHLRSHGGTAEQSVPFILSHRLAPDYARRATAGLRNFDIFDYALNGVSP
jgi:phosphonoacetate hydrolase